VSDTPEQTEDRASRDLVNVEEMIAALSPGAREFALVEVRRLWFAAAERHGAVLDDPLV
jgi:hypothetical protein